MKITIISGRAGSGKSICLHVLEDFGYYCIDNLPVVLLPALIEQLKPHQKHVAINIDARNSTTDLEQFTQVIQTITSSNTCEIIFFDADESVLLKRFSETRRKHPLSSTQTPLKEALAREAELLEPISYLANLRIDTSRLSVQQLRDLIIDRIISRTEQQGLSLLFQSFGYKFGVPLDADFTFDVRCLANPYWEPSLRSFNGLDNEVAHFLEQQPMTEKMLTDITQFLTTWLPEFENGNRNYLTVGIGCTGGQHRSVYIAEQLAKHFQKTHSNTQIRHREL
jgi:UPF0042 nucleotide-binding protein